jgi:hypothetical protein
MEIDPLMGRWSDDLVCPRPGTKDAYLILRRRRRQSTDARETLLAHLPGPR